MMRGVVTAVSTAIIAQRSPIGSTIIRRTQTVQPTLSSLSERAAVGLVLAVGVVVGLVEGEVHDVAAGLQHHRAERQRPYVVAAAGGAEGEARVVGVLLGAVEGGVQPGAERGVLQRVAGELPVGAVQDEGEEQQHAGGDEAAAGAGGRAARRDQRGEQRGGGDLVRGQAAAGAPAGEVAGVRADAEGGEEAVAGLHGDAQPYGLVVDGGDGLPGLVAGLRVGGHGGDERCPARAGARRRRRRRGRRRARSGSSAVGTATAVPRASARAGGARAGQRRGRAQGPGSAARASGCTVSAPGTAAAGKRGSVRPSRRAWTWPDEAGVDERRPARSPGTAASSVGGVARRRRRPVRRSPATADRPRATIRGPADR